MLQTYADLDSMRLANRQDPYVKLPSSRSAETAQVQYSFSDSGYHFFKLSNHPAFQPEDPSPILLSSHFKADAG